MILRKIKHLIVLAALLFAGAIAAQESTENTDQENEIPAELNAYREYIEIPGSTFTIPTVIETVLDLRSVDRKNFAVLNMEDRSFEPYYFKKTVTSSEQNLTANLLGDFKNLSNLTDDKLDTSTSFDLPVDGTQGAVDIQMTSTAAVTASSLNVLLDRNVAYPTRVEIRALVDGQEKIVLASSQMFSNRILFPETTSSEWMISFTYSQPLVISELDLNQENVERNEESTVRFLAQPSVPYRLYLNPDRSVRLSVSESGQLSSAKGVFTYSDLDVLQNPRYKVADIDGDGIADVIDNCVSIANPDQIDVNRNNRGDVCDDFDYDGVINSKDNCVNNPNRNQNDEDGDGIGDVCDEQESRITERLPWLVWIAMLFGAFILIGLTVSMVKSKPEDNMENDREQ